jgi:hypothetical protein
MLDPLIISQITETLSACAFNCAAEIDLQDGIAEALRRGAIPFDREVHLGPEGQIDFVVPIGIGVEIKIKGSLASVTRQLHRYACCDRISSLILVTTRMYHDQMPGEMNGKPLRVIHLIQNSL